MAGWKFCLNTWLEEQNLQFSGWYIDNKLTNQFGWNNKNPLYS